MVHVADYSEHEQLVRRVELLENYIEFFVELSTSQRWLSREQTMQVLDCSETTLWKLTKAGVFTFRRLGRKIQYDVHSVRQYLQSKRIEAFSINQRIMRVYQGEL